MLCFSRDGGLSVKARQYRPVLGVDANGPEALQNPHPRAHAAEYRVFVVQVWRRRQREKELRT